MSVSAASFTTASDATSGSFVLTKPTGLEVDDLMVAFISSRQATPYSSSGWTVVASEKPSGVNESLTVLSKTADAGDVAASNFTFTSDANDFSTGILYRLSSSLNRLMYVVSNDKDIETATTSASYAIEVLPYTTSGLFLAGFKTNAASARFSAYSLSPTNPTWTEDVDTGSNDCSLATITAAPTDTTATTALAATISTSAASCCILLTVAEQQDAPGTSALLTATPVFFSETAQVDTNATAGLLTTAPAFFPVTGRTADAEVEWTDQEKGSATWTDQTK